MRVLIASVVALLLCLSTAAVHAESEMIRYVGVGKIASHVVIVDTRAQAKCQQRSLAGAHCLPASDLLGPAGELPSFADIFWALGTAGLDGSETVVVAGDEVTARDFVAGLLYLCGQAKVEILRPAIRDVLQSGKFLSGQGIPRAILRQRIYRATMRDTAMILPGELKHLDRKKTRRVYLDAMQFDKGQSLIAEHNKAGQRRVFVVYASSVRNAVAWFARLLTRTENVNKDIKVAPEAMSRIRGNAKLDGIDKPTTATGILQGVITRGERTWS